MTLIATSALLSFFDFFFGFFVVVVVCSPPFDVVHCDILPLAYCLRDVTGPYRTLTDHDVSYLKAKRLAAQMRNPALKLFLYFEALKLKWLESRIFSPTLMARSISKISMSAFR